MINLRIGSLFRNRLARTFLFSAALHTVAVGGCGQDSLLRRLTRTSSTPGNPTGQTLTPPPPNGKAGKPLLVNPAAETADNSPPGKEEIDRLVEKINKASGGARSASQNAVFSAEPRFDVNAGFTVSPNASSETSPWEEMSVKPAGKPNPLSPAERKAAQQKLAGLRQEGKTWLDQYLADLGKPGNRVDPKLLAFLFAADFWDQRSRDTVYLMPNPSIPLPILQAEIAGWVKEYEPAAHDQSMNLEEKKRKLIGLIESKSKYDPNAKYLTSIISGELKVNGRPKLVGPGGQECTLRGIGALGILLFYPEMLGEDNRLVVARYSDHDDLAIYNENRQAVLLGNYAGWQPVSELRADLLDPMVLVAGIAIEDSQELAKLREEKLTVYRSTIKQTDNVAIVVESSGAPAPNRGGGGSRNTFYEGGGRVTLSRQDKLSVPAEIPPGTKAVPPAPAPIDKAAENNRPDYARLRAVTDKYLAEARILLARPFKNDAEEQAAAQRLHQIGCVVYGANALSADERNRGNHLIDKWHIRFAATTCYTNPLDRGRAFQLFREYEDGLVEGYKLEDFVRHFFRIYANPANTYQGRPLADNIEDDLDSYFHAGVDEFSLSVANSPPSDTEVRDKFKLSVDELKAGIFALSPKQADKKTLLNKIRMLLNVKAGYENTRRRAGYSETDLTSLDSGEFKFLAANIIVGYDHYRRVVAETAPAYAKRMLVGLGLAEPLNYDVVLLKEDALARLQNLSFVPDDQKLMLNDEILRLQAEAGSDAARDIATLARMAGINDKDVPRLVFEEARREVITKDIPALLKPVPAGREKENFDRQRVLLAKIRWLPVISPNKQGPRLAAKTFVELLKRYLLYFDRNEIFLAAADDKPAGAKPVAHFEAITQYRLKESGRNTATSQQTARGLAAELAALADLAGLTLDQGLSAILQEPGPILFEEPQETAPGVDRPRFHDLTPGFTVGYLDPNYSLIPIELEPIADPPGNNRIRSAGINEEGAEESARKYLLLDKDRLADFIATLPWNGPLKARLKELLDKVRTDSLTQLTEAVENRLAPGSK
ncbi:MAG: hypothetical protein WCW67_07815 [Candidatus Margulisiibacteriota bacterium]|jgi:hypothetical protein